MIIKRFSKSEEGHKKLENLRLAGTTILGGSTGATIGLGIGEHKKSKLLNEALDKAKRADSLAEKFNQRLAGIKGRRISPEGVEYLNTIKRGIEKEGKDAIELAKKSKSLPTKGVILGAASGAALGYGARKLMKKNKKKKNK